MGRGMVAAACGGTTLFGLLVGILIGRCGGDEAPPPPPAEGSAVPLARLVVQSAPIEANVLVDGRFVGVTPVERIDLDPGKHSVVIDSFGYEPYAGLVEVEPGGRAKLKAVLAPLGGKEATRGEFVGEHGGGKATNVKVPATALSLTGTGTSKDAVKPPRASGGGGRASSSYTPPPAPAYEPPPRPRRDCHSEKSQCRDGCSRVTFSCRSDCPHCVSCPSSVGSDECRRQCDTCRSSCEQSSKFCETSCDNALNSCQASNN